MKLSLFQSVWNYSVLVRPSVTLLYWLLLSVISVALLPELRFDIEADSLVLENDTDLDFYRSIRARYGSDSIIVFTYDPPKDVFSPSVKKELVDFQKKFENLDGVENVSSILNVPLFESPKISFRELTGDLPTLLDKRTNDSLARKEIIESPLYKNQLVSGDGDATSFMILLSEGDNYSTLTLRRDKLLDAALSRTLNEKETHELHTLNEELSELNENVLDRQQEVVQNLKKIKTNYTGNAHISIGGLPVIISDMMSFVKQDLVQFGTVVIAIMALILYIVFRSLRWVFAQVILAVVCGIVTTGFLALASWPITVVSSSYFALLIIFTMSITIHLLVTYQEYIESETRFSHKELIVKTLSDKISPCFWTVLTTSIAFSSLVVSEVGPVVDFGLTMVVGLWIGLLLSFTLFPALLVLMPQKQKSKVSELGTSVASYLGMLALKRPLLITFATLALMVLSSWGITKLRLENRFLDYFKEDTEIYQSTYTIDTMFGGTMPLDIILNAPSDYEPYVEEEDDLFFEATKTSMTQTSYWLKSYMIENIKEIHRFVESFEAIGKVVSVATPIQIVESLNDGKPLENYELAILLDKVTPKTREVLIDPYVGPEGNQIRISTRVQESNPHLDRFALIDAMRNGVTEKLDISPEQIRFTGMFVLYNNMIKSLFRSQILTLGTVFVAILALFIIAFRSFKLAAIAIVPNAITATFVLGIMGLTGVPLNFMTITIAAVTIGIAVDDTIHYIHRFMQERQTTQSDVRNGILEVHRTIGLACFCTTLTISLGFTALFSSQFLPTVYFGLLTGLAMLTAFVTDMTVLPILLKWLVPNVNTKDK